MINLKKKSSKLYSKCDLGKLLNDLTNNIFDVYSNFLKISEDKSNIPYELRKEYKNIANKFLLSNLYILINKYIKLKEYQSKGKDLTSAEKKIINKIESLKLCHYTSFENFQKMLENHQLWFSTLTKMNDSDEGKFLNEYIKNIYLNDTNFILLEKIKKNLNNFFTFSFTTEIDNSTHWVQYGSNGQGICLVSSFKKICLFFNQKTFSLTPILYLPLSEREEHNIYLDSILSTAISKKESKPDFIPLQLASWSPVVKNSSFNNESEFRLIYHDNGNIKSFHKSQDNKFLQLFLDDYIKERNLKGDLFSLLYEGIVIGPECSYTVDQINSLLDSKINSNLKVDKSKSTLIQKIKSS